MKKITYHRLLEVLEYSIITGEFFWKVSTARRRKAGDIAGSLNSSGYVQIQIDGENFYGHLLAHFYLYEEWPKTTLDHRNRDKSNNAWINLREASATQNNQNVIRSKSGKLPGVYTRRGYLFSKIVVNGKAIPLGRFDTEQETHDAYKAASLKYFGEFSPFFEGNSNG